ncbi:MAG: tRNA pseudouridine(38-40) synthase TruA [Bacteroidetes bacterium]|nr:MAG: tRNA pseudouridine(38-40) synthase TruA [Bacteroidota bacterium]
MKRYFLKLAYNGTRYHGWQVQENAHTVQAELEQKLSLMLNQSVTIIGCGRTDTGVHAREYYAHFEVETFPFNEKDFVFKINRFLSKDIAIYGIVEVDETMHARFSAVLRTYKYYISRKKNPFEQEVSYFYNGFLDIAKMNRAATMLLSFNDFTSFSKLHTQTATNFCNVSKAEWECVGEEKLIFTISADRFLRNMVRAIVGTLLEVGKGKMTPERMVEIIEAKNRSEAGFSVPAKGLFLEKIAYSF